MIFHQDELDPYLAVFETNSTNFYTMKMPFIRTQHHSPALRSKSWQSNIRINRRRRSSAIALSIISVALICLSLTPVIAQEGRFELIVDGGSTEAPDGNGVLNTFTNMRLNDLGQVGFKSGLTGTTDGNSDIGIFRGGVGGLTQIVRNDQSPDDGNGSFSDFPGLFLNNSGITAFGVELTGTSGTFDDRGVFRGSDSSLTEIVRGDQAAPDGNGTFRFLGPSGINDSGDVSFIAAGMVGTSGGTSDDLGIYRGNGGGLVQIAASEGQVVPDGNGTILGFSSITGLNEFGEVAFIAGLTGTSGGSADDLGIFRSSGGGLTRIVRTGQAAPDGNGSFFQILPLPR